MEKGARPPASLPALVRGAVAERPGARIGTPDDLLYLEEALRLAEAVGRTLANNLASPGDRVAIAARPSSDYMVLWIACQLAGLETALIHPDLPASMKKYLVTQLDPRFVVGSWGPAGSPLTRLSIERSRRGPGGSGRQSARLEINGRRLALASGSPPPLPDNPLRTAGYMTTSGTLGPPKLCAQSDAYFCRLAQFVAAGMNLTEEDTVFVPLPLHHINPLGYGVLGGLACAANVVFLGRFSASSFWRDVHRVGATAVFLHGPPREMIKQVSTASDADGHRIRRAFFADREFMDRFGIPYSYSAYGSTEAAGITHLTEWDSDAAREYPRQLTRVGGLPRPDIECVVTDDGEILVKEQEAGSLFTGYLSMGLLDAARDEQGWFHTGDLGEFDRQGRLCFVERRSEAIRVSGEYVPIEHVEAALSEVEGIEDLALWKEPDAITGDRLILFMVGEGIPLDAIKVAIDDLPRFMRPTAVVRVNQIPRSVGIGKLQRRRLQDQLAIERLVIN